MYYQIWDGPPNDAGSSVVFGDLTTNRLLSSTFTNIQRDANYSPCDNARYIFANVASAGITLPAGVYWLDWKTDGSLASGPWAPPVTILGQTTTGNALIWVANSWLPALDPGTSTPQGMPFIIEGSALPAWAQIEIWDPARLLLLDWVATGGNVVVTPGRVEWTGELTATETITLTKRFHVEPSAWAQTLLGEEFWLGPTMVEERPVIINKLPPMLLINAVGGGSVYAGDQASFTLNYSNTGGAENNVMIRSEFPATAPFKSSTPSPSRVDPAGRWAEWDVALLAKDAAGAINVTVTIQPALPPSTTIEIWGKIFDHIDVLRGEAVVIYHVELPYRDIYLPIIKRN